MEQDTRPWGNYQVLAQSDAFKIKKICVLPKQRLSLQRHKKRQEHWYILQGTAVVTLNTETLTLLPGQSVDIAQGAVHRVENSGSDRLEFIEIQTGESFDEQDIERLEDDYHRV